MEVVTKTLLVFLLLSSTTSIFTTVTAAITDDNIITNPSLISTEIIMPINNEISLHQKLISSKLTNSIKANWLLDYKTLKASTYSKPNETFLHLLLLSEPKSMARPRDLELIVADKKNFELSYYKIPVDDDSTTVTPSDPPVIIKEEEEEVIIININKCTPLVYNEELKIIKINLDEKLDVKYGGILDINDNTSKSRSKRKHFPKLSPKTAFKLLTRDPVFKKVDTYYVYIYLTTLKEHFDHYFQI